MDGCCLTDEHCGPNLGFKELEECSQAAARRFGGSLTDSVLRE
jgi:hypothetical protein